MRVFPLLIVWLSFALSACAKPSGDCAALDAALVYCPAPQAPRVTELKSGHVVVQLIVRPDGSVADARIASSSGHAAWKDAVLQAVRQWRYAPSGQGTTKVVPFDLTVGG